MTQWEAFTILVKNGAKRFFNPMYGYVKLTEVDSKNKTATFETRNSVTFIVTEKFKLSINPFIKQCVFPTRDCEDFSTYLRKNCKQLLLKPNSPVCFTIKSVERILKFGVLIETNLNSMNALVEVYGETPKWVPIKSLLTIQEAKELIKNQSNVQSIQD